MNEAGSCKGVAVEYSRQDKNMQSKPLIFRLLLLIKFISCQQTKRRNPMSKNRFYMPWVLIAVSLFIPQLSVFAAEHAGDKVIGAEEKMVQKAAQDYINTEVKKQGIFEIDDAQLGKKWKLAFDYFHTVNQLDNGDYFFCADFTEGKDRLDLDFTLSGEDLKVKQLVIHKVNGVAR